jgi:hypothetical protein
MASADGTGDRAVPISISPAQASYLCRELSGFKADLEGDLKRQPHTIRRPSGGVLISKPASA